MSEEEIWKPIAATDGRYLISNKGRVRSIRRVIEAKRKDGSIIKRRKKEMFIKPAQHKGYLFFFDNYQGKSKHIQIHRAIAAAFIPNPENKPQVNHIDGNGLNNSISNLEWCTNSENMLHAIRTGLKTSNSIMGSNSFHAKLDVFKVLTIRTFYKSRGSGYDCGKYSIEEFRSLYNTGRTTIINAASGKKWGDASIFQMIHKDY